MSFTVRTVRQEKPASKRMQQYTLFAVQMLGPLFRLYRQIRDRKQEEERKEHRMHIVKRILTIVLMMTVIIGLFIATFKILLDLKTISLGKMMSAINTDIPRDTNGFTNILLLGVGDDDHSGIDLTDTIMIASLDPKSQSTVLLSLPRDIEMLATEKMGKGRINSLYRDYKTTLIRQGMDKQEASVASLKELGMEIQKITGLSIQGIVKINFSGFEEAINALGGIDIDVPRDLVDTEYPGPNYSYETFSITKGLHHIDGATALKYARSRHSTSDFSRSERQQQIIAAASEKAKKMGLKTVAEMINIISKNVETTFDTRSLIRLAQIGEDLDQEKIVTMQISDQNGLFNSVAQAGGFLYSPPRDQFGGAAVLLPVSIPEFPVTWDQFQALSKLLFLKREAFIDPPTIMILNAGAKEGSARLLGNELVRYGFTIVKTRNFSKAPNPSFDRSFIAMNPALQSEEEKIALSKKNATASLDLLHSLLGISPLVTPDPLAFGDEQPDLVIVLGKDYKYTPLVNLIR